jgi:pyrophosphatase PpaX
MTRIALLFDLDGTLIDSIELLLECAEFAFEGRSPAPTRQQWVAGIGTPLRTQLAEWAVDDADADALVAKYRDYQDRHLERLTTPYPGALDVLAWARDAGHAIGLVTSKGRIMTARSLTHVGLADAFDTVVTYEETTRHKPLADPVLLALSRLDLPAERALFVGDSPHDMYSGRAAGTRTAAATWGPFSRAELAPAEPTLWLSSLAEIPAVIAGIEFKPSAV